MLDASGKITGRISKPVPVSSLKIEGSGTSDCKADPSWPESRGTRPMVWASVLLGSPGKTLSTLPGICAPPIIWKAADIAPIPTRKK